MRQIRTSFALVAVLLVAIAVSGCCGNTYYKIAATTAQTVDFSMKSYGEAYRAGLVKPEVEVTVHTLYNQYQIYATQLVNLGRELQALCDVSNPTDAQKQATVAKQAEVDMAKNNMLVVSASLVSEISKVTKK